MLWPGIQQALSSPTHGGTRGRTGVCGPWPCPRICLWQWAVWSSTGEGTDNQDETGQSRDKWGGDGLLEPQAEAQCTFLSPTPPHKTQRGTAREDPLSPQPPHSSAPFGERTAPHPTWGLPAQTTAPGRLPWPLTTSLPWPGPHPAQPPAQKWQHLLAPHRPPLTLLRSRCGGLRSSASGRLFIPLEGGPRTVSVPAQLSALGFCPHPSSPWLLAAALGLCTIPQGCRALWWPPGTSATPCLWDPLTQPAP